MAYPATCSDCDRSPDEEFALPGKQRKPCPYCGSSARIFNLTFDETLALTGSGAPPSEDARAVRDGQADLVCSVRIMRLPEGAFFAEVEDAEGGDSVIVSQLSIDDAALGIAIDIARRLQP